MLKQIKRKLNLDEKKPNDLQPHEPQTNLFWSFSALENTSNHMLGVKVFRIGLSQ